LSFCLIWTHNSATIQIRSRASMSSYQLSEAVQFAQAGRREEARRLLWQIVQIEPNNEVAWLWLATVAADGNEYQRALNEVLRINPNNVQARQLIADYQRQSYAPMQPPPGYPVQQQPPPPSYQQAGYVPYQPYAPTIQPKKRRGCNCCMIPLLVLVVIPMLLCCGLSYTNMSLGPADAIAGIFPGPFGRKEVTLEDDQYEITLTVPRSWYIADENSSSWNLWRGILDKMYPFKEGSWDDYDMDLDHVSLEDDRIAFMETNPVIIGMAGTPIAMGYAGIQALDSDSILSSFECDEVRALAESESSSEGTTTTVFSVGNGLCGLRVDDVHEYVNDAPFKNLDAPDQERQITIFVPFTSDRGTIWSIFLSENVYDSLFKDDIELLIDSIDVNRK
jgi:hypothetical protein